MEKLKNRFLALSPESTLTDIVRFEIETFEGELTYRGIKLLLGRKYHLKKELSKAILYRLAEHGVISFKKNKILVV